jgi:hypothetical protein
MLAQPKLIIYSAWADPEFLRRALSLNLVQLAGAPPPADGAGGAWEWWWQLCLKTLNVFLQTCVACNAGYWAEFRQFLWGGSSQKSINITQYDSFECNIEFSITQYYPIFYMNITQYCSEIDSILPNIAVLLRNIQLNTT